MVMIAFDHIDRQILEILQREGRITNAELALRVGLTPGPTLSRVNKLESSGLIRNYVAILDRTKLSLGVTAFVSIILKQHGKASSLAFVEAMLALPEVLECHHIAGEEDFLLKVVAASPADYEEFVLDKLSELPEVSRVNTTFVLSSPKSLTAVPLTKGFSL